MIDIRFCGTRKDTDKQMTSDSLLQTNFGTMCLWAPVGGWTEIVPESLRQMAPGVGIQATIDRLEALAYYCESQVEVFAPTQSLWIADVKALKTAIDILERFNR